jgi:antirestriction protein ArdC
MTEFGSEPYTQEELVAEIGTCYLQSLTGITSEFDNSAAYIQSWLKKLKNDKHFIITAASQAQKAVDFILNVEVEDAVVAEE